MNSICVIGTLFVSAVARQVGFSNYAVSLLQGKGTLAVEPVVAGHVGDDRCNADRALAFQPSNLLQSNLGGLGPDFSADQHLFFGAVLPNLGGRTVDLEIDVKGSSSYAPSDVQMNGQSNGYITISLLRGSQARMRFVFIDRDTKLPRSVPPFMFSVLLWNNVNNSGTQKVSAKDFLSSSLSKSSVVNVSSSGEWTQFSADISASDNRKPHMPMQLQPREEARMVSLNYPAISSFEIILEAPNTESTTFYFAGRTSLACGFRETCSSAVCPAYSQLKPAGESTPCAGATCTSEDVLTCCDPVDDDGCKKENIFWLHKDSVLWSNLMGMGPDNGANAHNVFPHSIKYGDVFPYSNRTVDMEVTANVNSSNYLATDSSKNGLNGVYANINVRGGYDVNLTLRFLDRESGAPISVGPSYLSFFDFDQQKNGGGKEVIKMTKNIQVIRSNSTVVSVAETESVLEITSTVHGSEQDNPWSPMNLTQWQKDKSVSVLMPTGSSFSFAVGAAKGWGDAGRNLLFTGPSSMMCPEKALCDTFVCPLGHQLRQGAENIMCHGDLCTDLDVRVCCEETVLPECSASREFGFKSAVLLRSNLGGQGPDMGNEGLVYGNVFPLSDWIIDLRVNSLQKYEANNADRNGFSGAYGQINLKTGVAATFKFSFINRTSGMLASLPSYLMSFLDFDTSLDSRGSEFVSISDFASYHITPMSEINVLDASTFGGSMHGTGADNPTHPLALTAKQKNRSITFSFKGTNEFFVNMSSSRGSGGRNIMFSGSSNLVCPTRALCTTMTCPAGFVLVPEADSKTCASDFCGGTDVTTCCEEVPPPNCDAENILQLDTLIHSNLGGLGPDLASHASLLYANVFPKSNSIIDLRVTNLSTYRPRYSQNNGLNAMFVQIDISNGSTVDLKFEFINRSTGDSAIIPHDFLISVFNLGQQSGKVNITPVDQRVFFTSQLSNVSVRDGTYHSLSGWTDFPVHPRALSPSQMNQSITFLFPSSSKFVLSASSASDDSAQLVLAGASNLVCNPRALCSSFSCPTGFMRKRGSWNLACAGPKCMHNADTLKCCVAMPRRGCEHEAVLKFEDSSVIYSNLHGHGPDTHRPEAILYGDVFPNAGTLVDMMVSTSYGYDPSDSSQNGLNGKYPSLNFRCGSSANLTFTFIERNSNAPFMPPPFYFTLFDFDEQRNGGGRETVQFNDHIGFEFVEDGLVQYGAGGFWSSKGWGKHSDNPTDPMHLNEEQRNRSVTFLIGGRSSFSMQVDIANGFKGRNILFGGTSNMACPEPAQCFTFICPEGYRHVEDTTRDCTGPKCTEADDLSTCCVKNPIDPCELKGFLHFHPSSLLHSNIGGLGPDNLQAWSMVFSDVFPKLSSIVDLEIRNLTEYKAHDSDENKQLGEFGQINVKSGEEVLLEFKFVNRSTGELATMDPYLFSFFDFDSSGAFSGVESLTVEGYRNFSTTPTAKVLVNNVTFTATEYGVGADNPRHALSLSQKQLDKSVSFLMKEEPIFHVKFGATYDPAGRNIMFGGPSNLVCPAKAMCSSYLCPTGWTLKPRPELIVCAGETCTEQDQTTCCTEVDECVDYGAMLFTADSVVYSNLGGFGPDFDMPEQLYFADVFPYSGKTVDLLIATDDDMYKPKDASSNGLNGYYVNLNFKTGSSAALNFTLIDRNTGSPVTDIGDFRFTMFDFDEQKTGGGDEIVRVPKHEVVEYSMAKDSLVLFESEEKHLKFSSTEYGNAADNPKHPMSLNQLQKAKSVSLRYNSSQWTVNVEVTPGHKGRNLLFAGASSLTCAPRAPCSTMQCPIGFVPKSASDATLCAGKDCTRDDLTTCCMEKEKLACNESDILGHTLALVHSNLGGHGPDSGEPVLVLRSAETDLRVVVEVVNGSYTPVNAANNGVHSTFLAISMMSGSDAVFRASFFDATGSPVFAPTFYFTVFGMDQHGRDEALNVGIISDDAYAWKLSHHSSVQVVQSMGTTIFHSSEYGFPRDIPSGGRTLTDVEKDNLATVLVKPTQSFTFMAAVSGGQSGRDILIGGSSPLTCSYKAPCEDLTCPRGFVRKANKTGFCAGMTCGNEDIATCCEWSSDAQ